MSQQFPWLRIFAEGVAIVVSILLAFGIQAWWDERQERVEEALLLGSLLDEFRADRPPLIERASQHEGLASSAAELLQILTT